MMVRLSVARCPLSVRRFAPLALLVLVACNAQPAQQRTTDKREPTTNVLKVCSDPNNLPFSNQRGEGFENRIAELIARDFGARVEYTWWPQHRGFIRQTLRRGECDVVMGIPSNYELALPTAPYYRSSYVFLSRRDRRLHIASLDDPQLRRMRIGVQLVGDEGSPAVYALASRKMTNNLAGFVVTGDYAKKDPTREIVDAVARGDVDVAIVWGPQAGWFARQEKIALDLQPVTPQIDPPFLPFVFDISMGVRRGETALRDRLDQAIERRRPEIERILDQYGVPRV